MKWTIFNPESLIESLVDLLLDQRERGSRQKILRVSRKLTRFGSSGHQPARSASRFGHTGGTPTPSATNPPGLIARHRVWFGRDSAAAVSRQRGCRAGLVTLPIPRPLLAIRTRILVHSVTLANVTALGYGSKFLANNSPILGGQGLAKPT